MDSYTINVTNSKSLSQNVINNYNLNVDYCCKTKNKITVYSDITTIENLKNIGYSITKNPTEVYYKNKTINKRLGQYHFQNDLKLFLDSIKKKYSHIASYETIGYTKKKRNLFMTKITSNIKKNYEKPGFLLSANIHGNETLGRELSIYLINYLCVMYTKNKLIKYLVDNTTIYIMPSLNPDGFERTFLGLWIPSRFNSNNIDLNRNFPDQFISTLNPDEKRELEVEAILSWAKKNKVHMSLSIHGGAAVVNYPYDGPISGVYSKSDDDDFFKYLAQEYVKLNSDLLKSEFKDGITNGSEWYALFGGMQDWQYHFKNTYELTLELSEKKVVRERDINYYWTKNKNSLINCIKLLHIGIHGKIINTLVSKSIEEIKIRNLKTTIEKTIQIDSKNFFIPLKPGQYKLLYKDLENDIIISYNYITKVIYNDLKFSVINERLPENIIE